MKTKVKTKVHKQKKGFTLMELLIVLSIVSTLVAVTAPTMFSMVGVAKDTATKSNLHALRTAVFGYYVDNNETWPTSLDIASGFIPKYMKEIPAAVLYNVSDKKIKISRAITSGEKITNCGGWIYNPKTGDVRINYNGKDSDGTRYFSY